MRIILSSLFLGSLLDAETVAKSPNMQVPHLQKAFAPPAMPEKSSMHSYSIQSYNDSKGEEDMSDFDTLDHIVQNNRKQQPPAKRVQSPNLPLYHFPYRPKFPAHPLLGLCQLSDFKKDEKLGRGGFGQVFKAIHKKTGIPVAIKHIFSKSIKKKPKHVEHEETIQRILNSPFIGQLYCTMTNEENDIFFVLQYFEGKNMTKLLGNQHPFPPRTERKYIAQILVALRYIHQHCIVYRDVKAENVMVDKWDNVRLIDFGLSVYDCENALTGAAGTIEYFAPEVASKDPHGRASDYYSLGVLAWTIHENALPNRPSSRSRQSSFKRAIAKGSVRPPPTGDREFDELLSILCEHDQVKRWKMVYEDFEQLKKIDYFRGHDWNLYDGVSDHWNLP